MIKAVIIDKDWKTIEKISKYIERNNTEIDILGCTSNGKDAERLIKEKNPNLVFIDTKIFFKEDFNIENEIDKKKIILLTESDRFEVAQLAIRIGADDIILKPIEPDKLKESLELVIGYNFTSNETVNGVVEYINRNYKKNITLREISEVFFINKDYISRIFKENMGITILKYINKVKIMNSLELIDQGYSLSEISNMVGYYEYNTFYRNFKTFTKLTPIEFVKKVSNEYN